MLPLPQLSLPLSPQAYTHRAQQRRLVSASARDLHNRGRQHAVTRKALGDLKRRAAQRTELTSAVEAHACTVHPCEASPW
jgi:hypothetical protein